MSRSRRLNTVCRILACCLLAGCQNSNHAAHSAQSHKASPLQDADTIKNLRELLVDVAVVKGCPYLTERILLLSSKGSDADSTEQPTSGNFWIHSCTANQAGPEIMEIELQGNGWRWIQRSRQVVGATFELGQIVCFDATVMAMGTFDLFYDPDRHTAMIYFVPTEPVEAEFVVTNDVDIDTETLWGAFVGEAAEFLGQSPQQRAREKVKRTARRRVTGRLDRGFTIVVDLCTSYYHTRFGTLPPGRLPLPEDSTGNVQVDTVMVLHPKGLLMTGPFEAKKQVAAHFENGPDGAFEAYWLCQQQARSVAWDYVDGQQVRIDHVESARTIEANQAADFFPPQDRQCPMVLVMRPREENLVTFDCRIWYRNDPARPLACPEPSARSSKP